MAAGSSTSRSRFTFVFLLLSSLTLLTLDARGFEPLVHIKEATVTVISPLRSAADTVFEPVRDSWQGVTGYGELKEENRVLREELQKREAEQIHDADASFLLEELRRELDLPSSLQGLPNIVADVIASNIGNFDEHFLQINRGETDGVRTGMPVVTRGGLVGRVSDAGERFSRVMLITHPDFEVGVQVVGTDDVALASGTGGSDLLRVDWGLQVDTEVAVGDEVVTSDLARSRYPSGIPVGTVTNIEFDQARLLQQLDVQLSASTQRLSVVTVLLYDILER